jgi:hypothetical protein
MTKGQNLKLERRSLAKEGQESRRQRQQRRRTRESQEERQPSIYQQLRGLREPQIDHPSLRGTMDIAIGDGRRISEFPFSVPDGLTSGGAQPADNGDERPR